MDADLAAELGADKSGDSAPVSAALRDLLRALCCDSVTLVLPEDAWRRVDRQYRRPGKPLRGDRTVYFPEGRVELRRPAPAPSSADRNPLAPEPLASVEPPRAPLHRQALEEGGPAGRETGPSPFADETGAEWIPVDIAPYRVVLSAPSWAGVLAPVESGDHQSAELRSGPSTETVVNTSTARIRHSTDEER